MADGRNYSADMYTHSIQTVRVPSLRPAFILLLMLLGVLSQNSCKGGSSAGGEPGETLAFFCENGLVPEGFSQVELHLAGSPCLLHLVCLPEGSRPERAYASGALGTKQNPGSPCYSWLRVEQGVAGNRDEEGTPAELSGYWWQQGAAGGAGQVAAIWVERTDSLPTELICDLRLTLHAREDSAEVQDDTIILQGVATSGRLTADDSGVSHSLSGTPVRLIYTIAPSYRTAAFHRRPASAGRP